MQIAADELAESAILSGTLTAGLKKCNMIYHLKSLVTLVTKADSSFLAGWNDSRQILPAVAS